MGSRMSAVALREAGVASWRNVLLAVWLALPVLWAWHPVPTLGTLAETVAVLSVASVLAWMSVPTDLDWRRFWLGCGGVLGLLLLRCLLQPWLNAPAYSGFWLGPLAVLACAMVLCVQAQRDPRQWLDVVALAVVVAALVNALIGFLQYWRLAALIDLLEPYLVYWDRGDNVAHGNVAQRNVLASLCLLGIGASIFLWPRRSWAALMLEGFLAYAVVLTASRTPLVIVLAALVLLLLRAGLKGALISPWLLRFVVPVLLTQILVPLLHQGVFALLGLAQPQSSLERLSAQGLGMRLIYYRLALDVAVQAGAWGLGWKSFPSAMVEQGYQLQLWGVDELPSHAHNLLLHLWVETGPVPALLVSFYPLWLLVRPGHDGESSAYARLSILVLLVHSWLEFPLWQPAFLFLLVAMVCVLERTASTRERPGRWAARTVPRVLATGLALASVWTCALLVSIARDWEQLTAGRLVVQPGHVASLASNPVIEPYADWLALNARPESTQQRVNRLERLAQWLPDSMMLGLLAQAYRAAGQDDAAAQIALRRIIVFGVKPDLGQGFVESARPMP